MQMEPGGRSPKGQAGSKLRKTEAAVEKHLESLKAWMN